MKNADGKIKKGCLIPIIILVVLIVAIIALLLTPSPGLVKKEVKKNESHSGSGDVIGEWGSVELSKSTLKETSQEDFKDFVENQVSKSGFDYFTIICSDGTGIVFPACNTEFAEYGELDDEGTMKKKQGSIEKNDNGNYVYAESQQ